MTFIKIFKCRQQDVERNGDERKDEPSVLDIWPQILASVIVISTVIQGGINLAYSGVLIPQLEVDPNIKNFTKDQASWIASLVVIAQPIGALIVGPVMDLIGRKKTSIITCIPAVIGWIIIYYTKSSIWLIYLARLLCGFSSGMSTVGVVYTAEISHSQFRPMLLSLNSVDVAFGILIATVLGVYMEWHTASLCFGGIALLSFIFSFFIPESPYWLANFTNADENEIKTQVKQLNRKKWLFDEEWARIQNVAEEKKKARAAIAATAFENGENHNSTMFSLINKLKIYTERGSYMPLFLMMVIFFLQQTSGTYVVIFYTVNIFRSIGGDFGFGFNEYNATTALGILRFVMSAVSTLISKKVGRRPIMIISSLGMGISCAVLSVLLHLNNINYIEFESDNNKTLTSMTNLTDILGTTLFDNNNITIAADNDSVISTMVQQYPLPAGELAVNSWWILIALLAFVSAGGFGQMVIPWTLMGELLPTDIRASGSGFLVSYASLILFVVIKTFPYFVDWLTLPIVFIIYCILSFAAVVFVHFYLPETFGKDFKEIAKYFEKKNVG